MSDHNRSPSWRDVWSALDGIDHPRGKLERVAKRYREAFLTGYESGRGEHVRITGGHHGDPTARTAVDKQDFREDIARVGAEIVHACQTLDAADAFFAKLCGETRARPREARHRVSEIPAGNGQVSIEVGLKAMRRMARRK